MKLGYFACTFLLWRRRVTSRVTSHERQERRLVKEGGVGWGCAKVFSVPGIYCLCKQVRGLNVWKEVNWELRMSWCLCSGASTRATTTKSGNGLPLTVAQVWVRIETLVFHFVPSGGRPLKVVHVRGQTESIIYYFVWFHTGWREKTSPIFSLILILHYLTGPPPFLFLIQISSSSPPCSQYDDPFYVVIIR